MKIYYVEDDKNIRELVIYTLAQSGLEVLGFDRGAAFWEAMRVEKPALILLDIMLPGESGLDIVKKLRASADTVDIPVIMLTAKGSEFDTIQGLDSGADDYISKPFGMMELVSRVKAMLRRTVKSGQNNLIIGDIEIDLARHEVTVSGDPATLTYREFELLRFLAENKGIVFSRETLLERVWGYDYDGGSRTVDVHVQTLRQKLMGSANVIETVRGVGYRAQA